MCLGFGVERWLGWCAQSFIGVECRGHVPCFAPGSSEVAVRGFNLFCIFGPEFAPTATCCCYCKVTSVMSNSVRPHRWQPTRLPRPWDSPGKSTGVGCHFLLQCKKVKSESEVTQSCPTLSEPTDCSLPGSSVHGIFQARVLEWGAIAFSVKPLKGFSNEPIASETEWEDTWSTCS